MADLTLINLDLVKENIGADETLSPVEVLLTKTSDAWEADYEYTTDDNLYVSYAVWNASTSAIENSFHWIVAIDGNQVYHGSTNGLASYNVYPNIHVNLGRFSAGDHTLTVRLDNTNAVDEENEGNNVYNVNFTVEQGESEPPKYLLSTNWQQGENPFNEYTPEDYLTGCVSLANSQILYYWAQKGYAVSLSVQASDKFYCQVDHTTSYTVTAGSNLDEYCGITLDELNEKLSLITYDSANYDEDDDIASMCLAAMLISNARANYNTSTDEYDVTSANINGNILSRANFSSNKVNFNASTWDTIRNNILEGKPALVSSAPLEHVLIVDGYDEDHAEFHLNFGWGNIQKEFDDHYNCFVGDGWYNAAELAALDMNYAIVNITPNDETLARIYGSIVDARDLHEETDISDGVGGILISTGDNGDWYVPISLPTDNLQVCVLGNTPEEEKVLFMQDQENRYDISYNLLRSLPPENPPLQMYALDDSIADVFLARVSGETWTSDYLAKNNGYIADNDEAVAGLDIKVQIAGRNKICDTFVGSEDANVLILTDDECGDALFLDDIYSDSGNETKNAARIQQINEIYAGAGNDVIDLTSKEFKYSGSGMTIHGGDGDDIIWTNKGVNVLFGDAGDDLLAGVAEFNEVFIGGTGNDIMHGVSGDNVFCFGEDWGQDAIYQSEGSVALVFAGSIDVENCVWNEENRVFSCLGNTVIIDDAGAAISCIYVGENKLYGAGELDFFGYDIYCNEQDSSQTLIVEA